MRFTNSVLVGLVVLATWSCGSENKDGGAVNTSGPDAECASFKPCGGSLIGEWTIRDSCYQEGGPPLKVQECMLAPPPGPRYETGTFRFREESFSMHLVGSASWSPTYSESCLSQMKATCAEINTRLSQDGYGFSGTCTPASSGGCSCSITEHLTANDSGTYAVSGSTLRTADSATSFERTWEYCVQGDTLRIRHTDTGTSGSFLTSVYVATRESQP